MNSLLDAAESVKKENGRALNVGDTVVVVHLQPLDDVGTNPLIYDGSTKRQTSRMAPTII
jgi:hypothetical protein